MSGCQHGHRAHGEAALPDPFRIAIVGGGTAGWLSALIIQDAAGRAGLTVDVAVVESSKIPTIGVGEGTTAVFRGLLTHLGFDEFEFLRETEATIKYGIRHRDWRKLGHTYDGPIDDPMLLARTPPNIDSSWLNQYCISTGRPVSEPHLFTRLMAKGRAPFVQTGRETPLPVSPFHHAYHFDQAKVGQFFRKKALGILQIDATVKGVEKEDGNITKLLLDGAEDLDVNFVIDCTGFRRAIIAEEMGAKWESYAENLPVNRAIPFWLDHKDGEEIAPYTLAWAQSAGWMWQIPTQSRMGCGYVYSDEFLTPDQAQAEIETALGHKIEPRADIKINSGRLDQAWINNCLATGLAQSFFEPLEATSIHGTIVQMLLFTNMHLEKIISGEPDGAELYNSAIERQADDFMTFINMHYVTERDDSPFWQHVRENCLSDITKGLIKAWSEKTPRRSDFRPFPGGLAHIEEQLYYPVLDGLGLLDRNVAKAELAGNTPLRAHARKTFEAMTKEFNRASGQAPSHRAFLEQLKDMS